MAQRRLRSTIALTLASGLGLAFLLLPLATIFGLGLYYVVGISLVADMTQVLAAIAQETDIAPSLFATPLAAVLVALLAGCWGLALSLFWRGWVAAGRLLPVLVTALPLVLPRFALAALVLLTGLQLTQWGNDLLGFGLVVFTQAAVAAPLVAGILVLGWQRVDSAWYRAAQEAGADDRTIFQRLAWPVLRPYLAVGLVLALLLSLGDFYLANALAGDRPLLSPILFSGIARNASPLYFALVAFVLLIDLVLVVVLQHLLRPLLPLRKERSS